MNRIKQLRKEKGVTVKELADLLKISQSMLTNYENGSSTPRDEGIWTKLAYYFGVTKGYVMGVSDNLQELEKRTLSDYLDDEVIKNDLKPIEIKLQSRSELDLFMTLSMLDTEDIQKTLDFAYNLTQHEKYADKKNRFLD